MRRSLLSLASVIALTACGPSGPIMLMDAGPTDTGGGGTDTGGGTVDTGTGGVDSGMACPSVMLPPPDPDQCDAETLTCLMGATTEAQQMACLDADSTGDDCLACLNAEVLASCTLTAGGCGDEAGLLQCCLDEECPTGDMACVNGATAMGGACVAQVNGMIMCVNAAAMAMRCGISPTLCFRDADSGFAPSFDARRLAWSLRSEVLWSGTFAH